MSKEAECLTLNVTYAEYEDLKKLERYCSRGFLFFDEKTWVEELRSRFGLEPGTKYRVRVRNSHNSELPIERITRDPPPVDDKDKKAAEREELRAEALWEAERKHIAFPVDRRDFELGWDACIEKVVVPLEAKLKHSLEVEEPFLRTERGSLKAQLSAAQAEIAELEETRKAWKQFNRALSDKLAEAVGILERQQKSDDWCNRPFNEDIGEFLAKIKGTEKQ